MTNSPFKYGVRTNGQLMHRWVWEQVHGPIPAGRFVCHRCDQPLCYRLDHLFLGTPADNMADMLAKGRGVLGRGLAHRPQTCGLCGATYQRPYVTRYCSTSCGAKAADKPQAFNPRMCGVAHPRASLTEAAVFDIRADPTVPTTVLMARYGVSKTTINKARSGITYSDLVHRQEAQ